MEATTATIAKYGNIINMERPVHNGDLFSRRHPKMLNRAKLFAPFAALVGFEDRVRNKEIEYVARHLLSEEQETRINVVLNRISRGDRVSVKYFELCAEHEKEAFRRLGQYKTISGCVRWVDAVGQRLVLDEITIDFGDLYQLEQLQ